MRQKPKDHETYGWNEFEVWANDNVIGDQEEDWISWWECWRSGCDYVFEVFKDA